MPKAYYEGSTYLPLQIESILSKLKQYICQEILYKDEPYVDAQRRFLLGDISIDQANRYNIQEFQRTELVFPFTVYKPGQVTTWENVQSHNAKSMHYYSDVCSCYLSAIPVKVDIQMVSFFARGDDHERARKILIKKKRSMHKIWAPVIVNGVSDQFCINVDIDEVANGDYAFSFQQWLASNKIFDLVHNFSCKFYDIISDATVVYPVDEGNIVIGFSEGDVDIHGTETGVVVPVDLKVVSTDPADDETAVPKTDQIIINFNSAVKLENLGDYFSINPFVEVDVILDSNETKVTLDPKYDMSPNITYNVTVSKELLNVNEKHLEEDYTFNFTTGA